VRRQWRRLLLSVLVIGSVMSGPARLPPSARSATRYRIRPRTAMGPITCAEATPHPRPGVDSADGLVEQNFAKAVAAAIDETRRRWRDFRSDLATRYGIDRASLMICAHVRDEPVDDCRRPQ
jgi:Sec-independent protein translocase protein TatA